MKSPAGSLKELLSGRRGEGAGPRHGSLIGFFAPIARIACMRPESAYGRFSIGTVSLGVRGMQNHMPERTPGQRRATALFHDPVGFFKPDSGLLGAETQRPMPQRSPQGSNTRDLLDDPCKSNLCFLSPGEFVPWQ